MTAETSTEWRVVDRDGRSAMSAIIPVVLNRADCASRAEFAAEHFPERGPYAIERRLVTVRRTEWKRITP